MNTEQTGEAAILTSGQYLLRVWTSPFACVLSDFAQEKPIWQMQAVRILPQGGTWQRVDRAEPQTVQVDRLTILLEAEDGSALTLEIAFEGEKLEVGLRAEDEGASWLAAELRARPDEHYVGFGERFDSLDQRGKQVDLWVEDGAQAGLTYIPVQRRLWPACQHGCTLRASHGNTR
jgi:hypothetical protein